MQSDPLLPKAKGKRVVICGGGWGGVTAAKHLKLLDPTLDVVLLEIDLGYILGLKVNPVKMAPLSKFPTVMRDIAVIVEEDVDASTIIKAIRKTNKELIRNVEIFDVYAGTGIPSGKKSIALTIHISSDNKTLTDFETNEVIEKVKMALAGGFNASFRI